MKVRKIIALAVATLLICVTSGVMGGSVAAYADRKLPIYRVATDSGLVALTFDAAWGSDKTAGILDLLDQYNIKCTFFLVSFWMEANPELVREIALRGHEIGTHSATHPDLTKVSADKLTYELENSCGLIRSLTGREVTLFRAPFGAYNNNVLTQAEKMGLYTIQWDCDSLDWKGLTAGEIAIRCQKATSGSIILCHNNSDNILDAIPLIIEAVTVKGLRFAPVGQIIMYNNFHMGNDGEQRSNIGRA